MADHQSNRMPKLILMWGVFCGSLSSAFVKMAGAPSSVLATYRLGIAVLLLTPYVFLKEETRKELFSIKKKDLAFCMLSGVFLRFICFHGLNH